MSERTFKFVFEGLSKTAAKMISRQMNDWFVEGKLGSANSWMEQEVDIEEFAACEDCGKYFATCEDCGKYMADCTCDE